MTERIKLSPKEGEPRWVPVPVEVPVLTSTANHTKWEELRLAMLDLPRSPAFRCKDLAGYYSQPDCEWFHHFRLGGYATMEFVDVLVEDDAQKAAVLFHLKRIGMAGHEIVNGFRVYGFARDGQFLDYF